MYHARSATVLRLLEYICFRHGQTLLKSLGRLPRVLPSPSSLSSYWVLPRHSSPPITVLQSVLQVVVVVVWKLLMLQPVGATLPLQLSSVMYVVG